MNVATQGRVSAGREQAGRAWVNLQFESDLSWPGYLVEKMRIVFYWTNEVDDRKHKVLCLLVRRTAARFLTVNAHGPLALPSCLKSW
jgi:hypothetical protein